MKKKDDDDKKDDENIKERIEEGDRIDKIDFWSRSKYTTRWW